MSMDTDLAPIDVAQHWPFIDRRLVRVPPAVRRALWLVAEAQVDTDGEACSVRARLLEAGGTPGEAGRVSVVLTELEARDVLVRYRGRGRRPHLWSIRPNLDRWRGFVWDPAASAVDEAICDCFCRAAGEVVARFPGQRLVELHRRAKFELLARDHIRPPGLLLVETRDNYDGRATRSERLGLSPVEPRDNEAEISPIGVPVNSAEELNVLHCDPKEEEVVRIVKTAIEKRSGQTYKLNCAPLRKLREQVKYLTIDQAYVLGRLIDRDEGRWQIPWAHTLLPDLLADRSVKEAGRSEAWAEDRLAMAE